LVSFLKNSCTSLLVGNVVSCHQKNFDIFFSSCVCSMKKLVNNWRWQTSSPKRTPVRRRFFDEDSVQRTSKRRKHKKKVSRNLFQVPNSTESSSNSVSTSAAATTTGTTTVSTFDLRKAFINALLTQLHTKKTRFKLVFQAYPEPLFLSMFGKRRWRKCSHCFTIQTRKVSLRNGKRFDFLNKDLQDIFSDVKTAWNESTFQSAYNDNISLLITSIIIKYWSDMNYLVVNGSYHKRIYNSQTPEQQQQNNNERFT